MFANGHLKKDKGSRDGIVLVDAQDVEVVNDILRGNRGDGIHARSGDRQRTSGVRIHHNSMRNDTLKGCKLDGVMCRANGK